MRALAALLLFPVFAQAAITLDSATGGNDFPVGTPVALSHTIGSGSDTVLLVGVSEESGATPNAPTYNGTTMTLCTSSYIEESTNSVRWYYLLDASLPAAGAHNVAITFGAGSGRGGLTAISFDGVDQSAPACNLTGSATSGTTLTTGTISSGDMAVALYAYNVSGSSFTPGAGQTEFSDVAGSLDSHGASYKALSGSTTMSATTASSITLGGVISAAVLTEAAAAQTVTYDQTNYSLDDLITATATGFTGTLTTITEQAGSDTISAEAGASSSSANFVTGALADYVASGSANNTQWGVDLTWQITDGTDTATDTFTIDAPTNGSSGWFQGAVTCNKGACPGDSVIEVLGFTGLAANDDLYCRTLSGALNASAGMSDQGVLAWDTPSGEIECRWFDESLTVWSAVATETYTAPPASCPGMLSSVLLPVLRSALCASPR